MSPVTLVRAGGLVVGVGVAAAVWRAPILATAWCTGAAVAAFGLVQAVYVFERAAVPATKRPSTIVTPERDWIDAAVAEGSSVALIPNPYLGPGFWWDVEFWNKTVERSIRIDGAPTFTPFPADDLSLDFETGAFRGEQEPDLHVVAINETRFHLSGSTALARVPPLVLVRVDRPFRAEWATRGADVDGWTRPGTPVTVRLYPHAGPGRRTVTVTLSAPAEALGPIDYSLTARGSGTDGTTAPGTFARARVDVCVLAGEPTDLQLVTRAATELPDGRMVGLHLDAVETSALGPCN